MFSLFFKVITAVVVLYCIFVLSQTKEIRSVYYQASIESKRNTLLKRSETPKESARVYFYDAYGKQIIGQDIEINKTDTADEKKLRRILSKLFRGPQMPDIYGFKTDHSILRNVFISEKTCYIDFSRNILSQFVTGIKAETQFLNSISKTCFDAVDVDKIKFLINGDEAETFKHISIDETFNIHQRGIL